jgi:hypothetical protein
VYQTNPHHLASTRSRMYFSVLEKERKACIEYKKNKKSKEYIHNHTIPLSVRNQLLSIQIWTKKPSWPVVQISRKRINLLHDDMLLIFKVVRHRRDHDSPLKHELMWLKECLSQMNNFRQAVSHFRSKEYIHNHTIPLSVRNQLLSIQIWTKKPSWPVVQISRKRINLLHDDMLLIFKVVRHRRDHDSPLKHELM